jgi:hypothetical protein
MNPGSTANATANEKVFRRLSYLLVFMLMASGVMTISGLIPNSFPDWHPGVIAAVLLFIVVDRLYTYKGLKSLTPLSSEWVIAYVAQWIVILVFLRLLLSYANGLDSFLRELSLFTRGYVENLFSPEFVFTVLLALLVWYVSGQFLGLLDEIGLDQELALSEDTAHIRSEAVPARQRLVNLIFSMGIVLVVITGLARINLRTIVSNTAGIPHIEVRGFSGGEAGALLYFVFGLALLSLGRLISLQTHWSQQRIPVSSKNLTRQWGVYSLVFLLVLAVIVSLLPSGDSLGLFSLLVRMLGFLGGVLFFIGQLILFLISLLLSLPFLFLPGDSSPDAPAPPPMPVLPPGGPVTSTTGSAIWELIRSLLLWGSLAVIVVYAFSQFVRQHGGLRAALRKSRVTNWLILAWQWLYRNAEKTRGSLARAITDGWQSIISLLEAKRILPPVALISLRSLDTRRRIYFYYLAMIRRGGEQGLPRTPSQTPSEYAVQLEKALPSAGEDIDSITEAFVQARYSRQEVDRSQADLVKAIWGRIRRAFQSKSKSEQSANK